jgi:EamA-like transporter family protein
VGVLVSMGVVFLGVLLVLRDGSGAAGPARSSGVLLAAGASVCWAAATVGGHAAMQGVGTFAGATVRLAGAAGGAVLLAGFWGLGRGRSVKGELTALSLPLRRRSVALALAPAMVCAGVFNLVPYHFALRDLNGAVAALLLSTTPLFTLPLAAYFGERFGRSTVIGTLVGFSGVAGVMLGVSQDPEPVPAELTLVNQEAPDVPGARWPDLTLDGDGRPVMSWVVPGTPNRLQVSTFGDEGWSEPWVAAAGEDWFVNWADFPQVAWVGGKPMVAWLEKVGQTTFAYGVRLVHGPGQPSWLHDDRSATEHGFVSLLPLRGGGAFAAWLDGRGTADKGPMTLRARLLDGPEFELDGRVCDCCQTDAVQLEDGRVLVAWRDRGEQEVRDIAWSVGDPKDPASFTSPRIVHDDGWEIPGCPVNGPALAAASGRPVAVGWFTMAPTGARVLVAFAQPDLGGFGAPVRVDGGRPGGEGGGQAGGRVEVVWVGDQLLVFWFEQNSLGARWRVRCVTPAGKLGPALTVGEVSGDRGDGFLRAVPWKSGALAAFRDDEQDGLQVKQVRVVR